MVSIIIPAYNAEKFIEETIQSVLNQTYSNWELIIVDDGSNDKTEKIIRKYLEINKISYYYQPNSGVSVARNFGMSKAKANGEYIALLDADDIWFKENLKEKVEVLESGEADWVFSDIKLIDINSAYYGESRDGYDINILNHYLLWDRTVVPGPCSNIVFKKECLKDGLKFDSQFSTAADQDFCFYLSSKFNGKRIPKYLWNYRILTQSMSRNIKVMEKDHIGVYKKAVKNNLFKSYSFRLKCFSNLYIILAGSWWKNGNNKLRGVYFLIKAVFIYPPSIIKLFRKLVA